MIVVATFKRKHPKTGNEVYTDTYTKADTIEEAEGVYEEFVERGAWSASICGIIKSTDYDPTHNLNKN